jgi:hypothetical protein
MHHRMLIARNAHAQADQNGLHEFLLDRSGLAV